MLERRRVPVVLQTANSDCGAAALAMVLGAHGMRVPVAAVRDELDAGRDGVTARDLRDAARSFGLNCRAFDVPELRTDPTRLAALPLPLVAHWNGDHFVVVERAGRRGVDIVDPSLGRCRLTLDSAGAALGGAVLLFESAGPVRTVHPRRPAGHLRELLLPVILRHRGMLAAVAAVSAVLVLVGLAVPFASARLVDGVTASTTPGSGWLVALAGLAAGSAVLTALRGLAVVVLQRRLGHDLATATVGALFRAAYRYLERRDTGDLVSRVASTAAVQQLLASSLIGTLLDGLLAVGYLVLVAVLSPPLAMTAGGLMFTQLALAAVLTNRTRNLQREELLATSQQTAKLVDAVSGAAAIRCAGVEGEVMSGWQVSFRHQLDAAFRRARVTALGDSVRTAVVIIAPLVLLLVAARLPGSTPGTAVGLAALAGAAVMPTGTLAAGLFTLAQLEPLLDRLADVVHAPPEQPEPRPAATPLRGRVVLADVGFRYDRRSPYAVRHVDVTIEAGMKVGIVGTSGSGKSTLIKLLTGLHQPTEGTIRFDGQDISTVDLTSLRRQLGVVLQEPFLTAGSIRDAISLGRGDAPDANIERAARLAAIHDEIMAMPMGYDTRLGDGGRGLSGGQRQRIALARALLGTPAVLLLDEATSALDVPTEARIEANLRDLPLTRVVVAHRLATVADADLILVFEQGVLSRRGTPAELFSADGASLRSTTTAAA